MRLVAFVVAALMAAAPAAAQPDVSAEPPASAEQETPPDVALVLRALDALAAQRDAQAAAAPEIAAGLPMRLTSSGSRLKRPPEAQGVSTVRTRSCAASIGDRCEPGA